MNAPIDRRLSPAGLAAQPTYEYDATTPDRRRRAIDDLVRGFGEARLAWALAWLDIRNRYRGSVLGPFWLTLSTGIMLIGLGVLYSTLFKIPIADYLPHLAVSLIMWNLISQIVNEATTSLTTAETIIRQMPLPYTVHALRTVMRNMVVAAHNLPLIFLIFLVFWRIPGPEAALALVGCLLIVVNGFAVTLFLGMLCARFRDIGPIVASVMQLCFFVTPILWKPQLLGPWQPFLPLNPFYSILETVRGPLTEGGGNPLAWAAALAFTLVNILVSAAFMVRFRDRVAYWV